MSREEKKKEKKLSFFNKIQKELKKNTIKKLILN
jgi:hypothetical protein